MSCLCVEDGVLHGEFGSFQHPFEDIGMKEVVLIWSRCLSLTFLNKRAWGTWEIRVYASLNVLVVPFKSMFMYSSVWVPLIAKNLVGTLKTPEFPYTSTLEMDLLVNFLKTSHDRNQKSCVFLHLVCSRCRFLSSTFQRKSNMFSFHRFLPFNVHFVVGTRNQHWKMSSTVFVLICHSNVTPNIALLFVIDGRLRSRKPPFVWSLDQLQTDKDCSGSSRCPAAHSHLFKLF